MYKKVVKTLFVMILLAEANLMGTSFAVNESDSTLSLDGDWMLATDPANVGIEQKWQDAPRPEAKITKVPWIIQDAFPGYHGLAWYWRDFVAPTNPHAGGRYLLKFWAVDYKADVWVNGIQVGGHEGGETPFVLDVTEAIKPGATNKIAVRVLNPTHESIDGILLNKTGHRNKVIPFEAGASYNHGGIVDSVELWLVPSLRIDDIFVRADAKTGKVEVEVEAYNVGSAMKKGVFAITMASAASGKTEQGKDIPCELPPGKSRIKAELEVKEPKLWDVKEPNLYRVTVRLREAGSASMDERSVRCGFRTFRFENGYFRLNGRRIMLRGAHMANHSPVGMGLPYDRDVFRRDLINLKAMGLNMVRFIAGMPARYQLDLCDEIGLLVYEEFLGSWFPPPEKKYSQGLREMILRDRNHPSIVIWGLLNETKAGPSFQFAVNSLPLVRELDDSRMVLLNSGSWDIPKDIREGRAPEDPASPGRLSNPESTVWEKVVGDRHMYPKIPHDAAVIEALRTSDGSKKPLFLSESGIGSGLDLWRAVRHYESLGKTAGEDARYCQDRLEEFLQDWERWEMEECFASPQDFFAQSCRRMAAERIYALNAIRSNPRVVGYSLTGGVDQAMTGEGLVSMFRELKPGTIDAIFETSAPLRLCLFAEPRNVYRGRKVKLEGVLANEDVLMPGEYAVQLQVIGPDMQRIVDRVIQVKVDGAKEGQEPPFAAKFFSEEIPVDGPAGRYRFLATMLRGGAPTGGEAVFHVDDAAAMPPVKGKVVVFGEEQQLTTWLNERGIRTQPYSMEPSSERELILVAGPPPAAKAEAAWLDLARRIACGSTAIFLLPDAFKRGEERMGWLPLRNKGEMARLRLALYHKDEWNKRHPIFEGMPSGGMMDYDFYRDIIRDAAFSGLDKPVQAIAGANNTSYDYSAGLFLGEYRLGAGRFLLNALRIRENIPDNPAAERLLRNMLNYATPKAGEPPTQLPANFDETLKEIGYTEERPTPS